MLETTGLIVGAIGYRRMRSRSRLLRAALLAQLADLVSLAFVWDNSLAAEHNPIANIVLSLVLPYQEVLGRTLAATLGWLAIAAMKTALMLYLDWAAPRLGRYRRVVLIVALAVGLLGAFSNVGAFAIWQGPSG